MGNLKSRYEQQRKQTHRELFKQVHKPEDEHEQDQGENQQASECIDEFSSFIKEKHDHI